MVQRLQTTRSLQDARQAFVVNAAGDALWMIGLSFVGFALLRLLPAHDRCRRSLRPTSSCRTSCRWRFRPAPWASSLPRSWRRRSRASIRRSTPARRSRSSISTTASGCGREIRPERSPEAERAQVRVSRIATRVLRRARAPCSPATSRASASLLEINAKVVNAFTGPLFGIFLLAMFSRARQQRRRARRRRRRRASPRTTWRTTARIGFMWPSTFGLAATAQRTVARDGDAGEPRRHRPPADVEEGDGAGPGMTRSWLIRVLIAVAIVYSIAHFVMSGVLFALRTPNVGQVVEELQPLYRLFTSGAATVDHRQAVRPDLPAAPAPGLPARSRRSHRAVLVRVRRSISSRCWWASSRPSTRFGRGPQLAESWLAAR